MSQWMPTRIQEKLLELEPKIFAFDMRLREMTAIVHSRVAPPSGVTTCASMGDSRGGEIFEDFSRALLASSDPLPACDAIADLILTGYADAEVVTELGATARETLVEQLVAGIRSERLRPFVERLLHLSPIEERLGLPQLIGKPDWIVHARLHRGTLIDLLRFAGGDEWLYAKAMEVLHARFVETWTVGAGFFDFRDKNPSVIATSANPQDLLRIWVECLQPYTIKALAELEEAHHLPLLTDKPDFDVYARCKRARFFLHREKFLEAVCRATTTSEVLRLLS